MKKFFQVILHILGFPLLLGVVVLANLKIIKNGLSYGIFPFIAVILTAVLGLVYLIVCVCMAKAGKKKGIRKHSINKQTFTAMILSFCMLGGLWMTLEVALPNLLADATSSTIFYEDLSDDYRTRADVNKKLLDDFIEVNVNCGALTQLTLEEYQAQGVKNEEVLDLLNIKFKSIDKDGYTTFKDPWISFALSDRMTIPDLIHLLLDTRDVEGVDFYVVDKNGKVNNESVLWNILDMQGTPMEIDISGIIGDGIKIGDMELNSTVLKLLVGAIQKPIADLTGDSRVLGSPVYLNLTDDMKLLLVPSNVSRGVLDYQSYAWLNSNGLLYAVVALFSTRNIFLVFAGWLVVSNYMIGLLRGMGKENKDADKSGKKGKRRDDDLAQAPVRSISRSYVEVNRGGMDPYNMQSVRQALIDDSRRGVARRYTTDDFR